MGKKYLLKYRKQVEEGWTIEKFSDGIIVGSGPDSDLNLNSGEISPSHFEIRENPTGIFIKDVDSKSRKTIVRGEVLPADRPTVLNLNEEFFAGEYVFEISLNLDSAEEDEEVSRVGEVKSAVKEFGVWKSILITLAIVVIAVVGGLFIFTKLLYKPQIAAITPAADLNATATLEPEEAATLFPTEVFELASTAFVEAVDGTVVAPGLGEFNLDTLMVELQGLSIADLTQIAMNPDQAVELATTISGEHIGYIYSYAGMELDGKTITTSMQFVDSDLSEEVQGVTKPDWGEGDVPVDLNWEPFVNYLEDGQTKSLVLLMPTIYGADDTEQIYRVDGVFQIQGSETQYSAMARFNADGTIKDILTFGKVGEERNTPYKVNFKAGDQFTPYLMEFIHDPEATEDMAVEFGGDSLPSGWEQVLQLAMNTSSDESFQFGIGEFEKHLGATLTFAENDIWWTTDENPDGNFVTGIAIEDLDGNLFVGYIPILVQQ